MVEHGGALPQMDGELFLADGGIETTLIFLYGLEVPDFAAFHLLRDPAGAEALRKYFRTYADLAGRLGTGLVLESAKWRASRDWGTRLGYDDESLLDANREAVALLEEIRDATSEPERVVISGCVGPRGDGYSADNRMSEAEAEAYHAAQVRTFAGTDADLIGAITMNYTEEALGIARAAAAAGMPSAISFTVETDGKLPTGQTLQGAIEQVEEATSGAPSYYMINCAHPTHFEGVLSEGTGWQEKIHGLRANASRKSHAELDESTELDIGDPAELAARYAALRKLLPNLNVMGGCCGTDERHIEQIASACAPLFARSETQA
jgi:S-methylmethionine-dependent homocysteine/selenocysteine methylase